MSDYLELGSVVNTHGVRGMIKILPDTDYPSQFDQLEEVFIGGQAYHIESVSFHKNCVLLKLAGIDDMDAAEKLRGNAVKIPIDKAVPLEDNEYFVRDLVGLAAITDDGRNLGSVVEIFRTGANDVYAIEGGLLIPAIKQCILNVDISAGFIRVHLLPGLEDSK